MRSEEQILELLISVANENENIRAVVLTGSRVNQNIEKDDFQDFDVIYLVDNLDKFADDRNWIDVFGERIIMQIPNSMQLDEGDLESEKEEITYLMLFKDFNRIDLKLIDIKNTECCQDSLSRVLLDKDGRFASLPAASEDNYVVKKPSLKTFSDCCNEFWWVATYVYKGITRNEPLYAKEMLEGPVRKMFMKMLAWHVGSDTGFSVNLGKCNRFLKQNVSPDLWTRIVRTYPDLSIKNIRQSLIEMMRLFHEIGIEVAHKLELKYNRTEANNVFEYIRSREESNGK